MVVQPHRSRGLINVYVFDFILEIICEELSNPLNGTVSLPSQRIVDSIATYGCNDSFELEGAVSVTCQLNGTWSAEEPICIGMMIIISIMESQSNGLGLKSDNGFIEKEALEINSTVRIYNKQTIRTARIKSTGCA